MLGAGRGGGGARARPRRSAGPALSLAARGFSLWPRIAWGARKPLQQRTGFVAVWLIVGCVSVALVCLISIPWGGIIYVIFGRDKIGRDW